MPAYKDNVHNTWYCMFYFEDWTGQKKKKKKCGFQTKKEALEWENEFKLTANFYFLDIVYNMGVKRTVKQFDKSEFYEIKSNFLQIGYYIN